MQAATPIRQLDTGGSADSIYMELVWSNVFASITKRKKEKQVLNNKRGGTERLRDHLFTCLSVTVTVK